MKAIIVSREKTVKIKYTAGELLNLLKELRKIPNMEVQDEQRKTA